MKNTIFILMISILIFILTSCCFEASQTIEKTKFAELRDSVFSRFIKIKEDTTNYENCIIIKPFNKVLMGTLIHIKLDNLPQNKNITLHAYRKNWEGLLYSFACFKTDSKGQIQLNKDKPISATYSGVDSLGIFWSMTKQKYINEELPFEIKNLNSNTIYFQLEADEKIFSKEELQLNIISEFE